MLKNDLSDIRRVRNPLTKRYTWRQKHPLIQRRLDFWLTSNSLQDDIEKNRYFNLYQNWYSKDRSKKRRNRVAEIENKLRIAEEKLAEPKLQPTPSLLTRKLKFMF